MSHNNKAVRIAKQIEEKFGNQVVVNVDRDYVWIAGDTYPIKHILKQDYGAHWARKKAQWYINCTDKTKSSNGKSASRKTKKSSKSVVPQLTFNVSWGTRIDEKSIVFGRQDIQAASIQKAKAVATKTVTDWVNSESTDERVIKRQKSFKSAMGLTCRWERIQDSKKSGLPFTIKKMGTWMGVLWFGEYILLKQVSK